MPVNIAGRTPVQGEEVEVKQEVRIAGRRYGFQMAPPAPVKGPDIEQPKAPPPEVETSDEEAAPEAPTQTPSAPAGAPTQPTTPATAPTPAPKPAPAPGMSAADLIAMAQGATTKEELDAIQRVAAGRATVIQAVAERRKQI
jgi:hypothetical protein